MDLATYKASLEAQEPPADLGVPLQALWWAGKGEWHTAHDLLQDQPDGNGSAWVHAWLHREEGDHANARYWYNRARKTPVTVPLQTEWDDIADSLIQGKT